MVSNDSTNKPAQSQASLSSDAKGDAASVAPMDPRGVIEVAPQGSGPVNDPPGSDNKPPNYV
ncbi:MAG: hypothetical protein WAM82_30820 [Thermoanaerobaculia bacterium]